MQECVPQDEFSGMELRVKCACISQRDDQPARRGVEQADDLLSCSASYTDNASASTLIAGAQSSQFPFGRGDRQEGSNRGVSSHVTLFVYWVRADRYFLVLDARLDVCRSAWPTPQLHRAP